MVQHTIGIPVRVTNATNITDKVNLCLFSNNVRGLNQEAKRKKHYYSMRNAKAHIYFTQEVHCSKPLHRIWQAQWGIGKAFFADGTRGARGCAIMWGKNFNPEVLDKFMDPDGRFIWMKISHNGQLWQIVNIYAPNIEAEQLVYYEKLHKFLLEKRDKESLWLLGGDWNVARNAPKDRKGGLEKDRPAVLHHIENIMQDLHVMDIWRAKHPWKRMYSWTNGIVHSRLDMWFI